MQRQRKIRRTLSLYFEKQTPGLMKKLTKLGAQWFYSFLKHGECDILDFKQQLEDKRVFGKPLKKLAPKYEETAREDVALPTTK